MAEKLHSQYGFSYDNLKVLLGGWNTWKQQHATDPAKYPEGGLDATPGASGQSGLNSSNPAPAITVIIPTPKP